MKIKQVKVLFFTAGPAPTDKEQGKAANLRAQVCFRNALMVNADSSLEICDGVTALKPETVPKQYAAKYPSAEEAIAKRDAEIAKLQTQVGDSLAESDGKGAGSSQAGNDGKGGAQAPASPHAALQPAGDGKGCTPSAGPWGTPTPGKQ